MARSGLGVELSLADHVTWSNVTVAHLTLWPKHAKTLLERMKPNLRQMLGATFLAAFLAACSSLAIGDGMFFVTGEFSGEPKNCSIYLQSESGVIVRNSQRQITELKFSEDFVVAPRSEAYEVVVSCNQNIRKKLIVHYGITVKPGKGVHLGEIAL